MELFITCYICVAIVLATRCWQVNMAQTVQEHFICAVIGAVWPVVIGGAILIQIEQWLARREDIQND